MYKAQSFLSSTVLFTTTTVDQGLVSVLQHKCSWVLGRGGFPSVTRPEGLCSSGLGGQGRPEGEALHELFHPGTEDETWSPSNLACDQAKVHLLGKDQGTSIKIPSQMLRASHENHKRGTGKCGLCFQHRAAVSGRPAQRGPRAVMNPAVEKVL